MLYVFTLVNKTNQISELLQLNTGFWYNKDFSKLATIILI